MFDGNESEMKITFTLVYNIISKFHSIESYDRRRLKRENKRQTKMKEKRRNSNCKPCHRALFLLLPFSKWPMCAPAGCLRALLASNRRDESNGSTKQWPWSEDRFTTDTKKEKHRRRETTKHSDERRNTPQASLSNIFTSLDKNTNFPLPKWIQEQPLLKQQEPTGPMQTTWMISVVENQKTKISKGLTFPGDPQTIWRKCQHLKFTRTMIWLVLNPPKLIPSSMGFCLHSHLY